MLGFLKSFSSNIHYKYSFQSTPSFEAGCWSVYDAKHKTTNDPVSVFVFNMKAVTKMLVNNGLHPKSAILAEISDFATKGVHQLTKIRHPAILKLVEPLETSKNSMTFVTERVVGSIDSISESDLDDLSVVRGLTTVVQALQFLHSQMGMVHGNICPRTVFADLQGDWKIAGLEFVVSYEEFPVGSFHLPVFDPRMPSYMHPCYDYLAPELMLHKTVLPANDVWSIACLLYAIYLRRSPLQTRHNPSAYKDELVSFRAKLNSPAIVSTLPSTLQPYLASLFCEEPEGRMTLPVLETTDFFQNPLINALNSMDEYAAKSTEDKVDFLKHFETLVPQFPKQMRVRKIVKFVTKELNGPRDPATGFLLGNVLFKICADMSKLSFQEAVIPLFGNLSDYFPFQESVASNLEVISRCTNEKDFSKSVLPVLLEILKYHDAQHVPLQVKVLSHSEYYAENLTVSKMEEAFFPAVVDCFAGTPARPVKTSATESLAVLVKKGVSKALITDRLIPALQAVKTRDPAVVSAIARLWKEICAKLSSQQVFTMAVPHLLELSLANQLTVDQFGQFMTVIRDLISQVEKNHTKTLIRNQPQTEDEWLNDPSHPIKPTQETSKSWVLAAQSQSVSFGASSSKDVSPTIAAHPVISMTTKSSSANRLNSSLIEPSSSKVLSSQRAQKLPALPPPNVKPRELKSQRTFQQPMMPALIPSSGSKANGASLSKQSDPNSLSGFATLQPQRNSKPDASDEFGSFISGNTVKPAVSSLQSDSLI